MLEEELRLRAIEMESELEDVDLKGWEMIICYVMKWVHVLWWKTPWVLF